MSGGGENPTAAERQKVVVGVDGSESSLRALRWAARHADRVGAPLEVVTAWTFPEHPAPLDVPIQLQNLDDLMDEARAKLDEIVADAVPPGQRGSVSTRVIRGNAGQVLLAEAESASLLVVGTRGRGEMERLVLGSVSDRCVRHSSVPVTVVP